MRQIAFSKASAIFVILLSQNGFETDCPETKVQNNYFLDLFWKSNCSEVHHGTLDSYFQSND